MKGTLALEATRITGVRRVADVRRRTLCAARPVPPRHLVGYRSYSDRLLAECMQSVPGGTDLNTRPLKPDILTRFFRDSNQQMQNYYQRDMAQALRWAPLYRCECGESMVPIQVRRLFALRRRFPRLTTPPPLPKNP